MRSRSLSRHHTVALVVTMLAGVGLAQAPAIFMRTPPEPVRSVAAQAAEYAARRAAVLEAMGPNDVLVLYAAEPRVFSGDVDYDYRQENNFWYLTGLSQPGGMLVLSRAATPSTVIYMIKPNPAQESWTGHQFTPEEIRAISGITGEDAVRDSATFGKLTDHVPAGGRLLLLAGDRRQYPEEMAQRALLAQTAPSLEIGNPAVLFGQLRGVKSAWEITLMQHAVDISLEGHSRAMALTAPGVWEYQIRAALDAVYGMRHAESWGYPEIVASGTNPTTLHYESDQEQIPSQGLMLIDAAAEYGHMSADVTRTYPINGKFNPRQAAIYNLVYDAQQAMIGSVKPGSPPFGPIGDAVLIAGLEKLGLITTAAGAPTPQQQLRVWYFHGPSHAMGLDVHDVGGIGRRPGAIFSMEPGLYFRARTFEEDLPTGDPAWQVFTERVKPVFENYKGIGVRIEDDVLVTDDGCRVLSAALPSKLSEVEARFAALRAYVRQHGAPPPLLP
ncbi:MAG TPA: Xaa-Pro aminopeptidase [Terriglobales bacterium]